MVASPLCIGRTPLLSLLTRPLTDGRRSAMRVRLKGINSIRKRLADGGFATYYYAWKGGPRLKGEFGSPEFIASYHEAVSARKEAPAGVVFALLRAYQDSTDFADLRDRTRFD